MGFVTEVKWSTCLDGASDDENDFFLAFPSTTFPRMLLTAVAFKLGVCAQSCPLCVVVCVHVFQAYLSFFTDSGFVFSG